MILTLPLSHQIGTEARHNKKKENQSQGFLATKQHFCIFWLFSSFIFYLIVSMCTLCILVFTFPWETGDFINVFCWFLLMSSKSRLLLRGVFPPLTIMSLCWLSFLGESRLFWACSPLPGRAAIFSSFLRREGYHWENVRSGNISAVGQTSFRQLRNWRGGMELAI